MRSVIHEIQSRIKIHEAWEAGKFDMKARFQTWGSEPTIGFGSTDKRARVLTQGCRLQSKPSRRAGLRNLEGVFKERFEQFWPVFL